MLQGHKWKIDISAGAYYPTLTQDFHGNDINFEYDNEPETGMYFYCYSYHIDEIEDPIHVATRLFSLQLIVNGSLRVSSHNPALYLSHPIRFDGFYNLDSRTRYTIDAEKIEDNPFSANEDIEKELVEFHGIYSNASYLVKVSKQDEDLRSLLYLAGLISTHSPIENIMTWGTLYKILDTVKQLSKENGLSFISFADQKDLKRFTAACNNMTVLGLAARHGKTSNEKPNDVITSIHEAVSLIISLSHNFCLAYVAHRFQR